MNSFSYRMLAFAVSHCSLFFYLCFSLSLIPFLSVTFLICFFPLFVCLFSVEEDTLLDMVHSMKEDVALVHQMPFVCDRKGFPAVLEKVNCTLFFHSSLFTCTQHYILQTLILFFGTGLFWNCTCSNIPFRRLSSHQLSYRNVCFNEKKIARRCWRDRRFWPIFSRRFLFCQIFYRQVVTICLLINSIYFYQHLSVFVF